VKNSWNILLLEDDEADKMLVKVALGRSGISYNLVHAKTIKEASNILNSSPLKWDCALLDGHVPDGNGLELLTNLNLQSVPCVMLTGLADESFALQALQKGLEDYIVKDTLNPQTLIKAIKYAIERNAVKQQLINAQKKLEEMVRIDPLTGVLNRRGLTELLERLMGRGETHGIVLIDIDDFKVINDSYGYDVGDQAIKLVATKLRGISRPLDHVARVGGDEFILLIQDVDIEKCKQIADRVRETIAEARLKNKNQEIGFTVSIGIATLDNAQTVEALLKSTQGALHKSKRGGKNAVYC
jgi:diguanylate cyclase (GGDEF)-like protein